MRTACQEIRQPWATTSLPWRRSTRKQVQENKVEEELVEKEETATEVNGILCVDCRFGFVVSQNVCLFWNCVWEMCRNLGV
ncbi:hypothetical protein KC19_VG229900 [Ceratodon purpureus]|uniref:Uncharacterized protein n=1 Tax=Ceratodon purpureus TaxID=3225 RepID=A0A8T0HSP1_CERPU|nr:hypothetical protein KC19_VG229900 [Ceratodon purpureus]